MVSDQRIWRPERLRVAICFITMEGAVFPRCGPDRTYAAQSLSRLSLFEKVDPVHTVGGIESGADALISQKVKRDPG